MDYIHYSSIIVLIWKETFFLDCKPLLSFNKLQGKKQEFTINKFLSSSWSRNASNTNLILWFSSLHTDLLTHISCIINQLFTSIMILLSSWKCFHIPWYRSKMFCVNSTCSLMKGVQQFWISFRLFVCLSSGDLFNFRQELSLSLPCDIVCLNRMNEKLYLNLQNLFWWEYFNKSNAGISLRMWQLFNKLLLTMNFCEAMLIFPPNTTRRGYYYYFQKN
jgi:hypothetical protein